jgi:hypothetical protein
VACASSTLTRVCLAVRPSFCVSSATLFRAAEVCSTLQSCDSLCHGSSLAMPQRSCCSDEGKDFSQFMTSQTLTSARLASERGRGMGMGMGQELNGIDRRMQARCDAAIVRASVAPPRSRCLRLRSRDHSPSQSSLPLTSEDRAVGSLLAGVLASFSAEKEFEPALLQGESLQWRVIHSIPLTHICASHLHRMHCVDCRGCCRGTCHAHEADRRGWQRLQLS